MRAIIALALAFAFPFAAVGQGTPTPETQKPDVQKSHLFVEPSSRWISMHDSAGTGAKAEFTLDILKSCSKYIVPVDGPETADYTVSIDRTGISSGSVVIYAKGDAVNSFKPGHSSTLQKVADTVCDFVKSRK
jgi:hypothetical protein